MVSRCLSLSLCYCIKAISLLPLFIENTQHEPFPIFSDQERKPTDETVADNPPPLTNRQYIIPQFEARPSDNGETCRYGFNCAHNQHREIETLP